MEFVDENNRLIDANVLTTKADLNDGLKWDKAHELLNESEAKGETATFLEPHFENKLYRATEPAGVIVKSKGENEQADDGYLKRWPKPKDGVDSFIWHKLKEYSELDEARKAVLAKNPKATIKICLIDTGYHPGHPGLPEKLAEGISFVKGEKGGPPHDTRAKTTFEQEGHGTATMSILAAPFIKKEHSNGKFEGVFGAIPFAEIVPVRISESVALVMDHAFVEAVDYAIDQGCEVISMSMGGAPSKAWAKAINKAYEHGIVVVTAAGNNFTKGGGIVLPKHLVYPARWQRVIAATGISADQQPYNYDARLGLKSSSSEYMQANYGPEKVMQFAVAAYTPNISWGTMNNGDAGEYFDAAGAGTSSATPQIAAAAALYICHYREELEKIMSENPNDHWKKVEMVRRAIFENADTSYHEYKTFYGRGSLKAAKALSTKPDDAGLEKAPKATVLFFGILDMLGLLLRLKSENTTVTTAPESVDTRDEMFALEVLQQLHKNERLQDLLKYDEDAEWSQEDKSRLKEILLSSPDVSERLKEKIRETLVP